MKHLTKNALAICLAAPLAIGCAGEDSEPTGNDDPTTSTNARNALTASQAAGDLMRLSQMTASPSFASGVVTVEGLDDLLDDLDDAFDTAGCVSGAVIDDDTVSLSFQSCALDGEDINGDVDVSITSKGTSLVVTYAGALFIDGCGFDGSWSVSIDTASIDFDADVALSHGGQPVGQAEMSASWSWSSLDLCPQIDLYAALTSAGQTVVVEVEDLDACVGMCSAGTTVSVEVDGVVVSGQPAAGEVIIGDGSDALLLSCDGGGDIIFDDGDDSAGSADPASGTWGYLAYTPIYNDCDVSDYFDGPGDFDLTNRGDGTFLVEPGNGQDPFDCSVTDGEYYCPNAIDTTSGPLTATGTASGSFTSSGRGSGTRDVTVDCTGDGCTQITIATGVTFPCTFEVQYDVARLGSN